MKRAACSVLVVCAASAAWAATAAAWEPIHSTRPVWRPPVPYSLNRNGSPDLGGFAGTEAEVRRGMDDWTHVACTSLTTSFGADEEEEARATASSPATDAGLQVSDTGAEPPWMGRDGAVDLGQNGSESATGAQAEAATHAWWRGPDPLYCRVVLADQRRPACRSAIEEALPCASPRGLRFGGRPAAFRGYLNPVVCSGLRGGEDDAAPSALVGCRSTDGTGSAFESVETDIDLRMVGAGPTSRLVGEVTWRFIQDMGTYDVYCDIAAIEIAPVQTAQAQHAPP